jgi:hypothetical protein
VAQFVKYMRQKRIAMGYERLLEEAGSFGLYQKLLCGLLVFYTTFLCGINYYTQVRFLLNLRNVSHYLADSPIRMLLQNIKQHNVDVT